MKNLRQKINNQVEKYGNKIYNGLGDLATTKINSKGLASLVCAGVIGFGNFGCAHHRPEAIGGINYELITNEFQLGKITQNNSRYKAKGVEIFGKKYYHVQTELGEALFSYGKAIPNNYFEILENEEIYGMTTMLSGEKGLHFVKPAKNKDGKLIDYVIIDPKIKKAIVKEPKIMNKKSNLGIFETTEQDRLFNIEFFTAIPGNPRYTIEVEEKKIGEKGFYDFYLIPVHKSEIMTNTKGKIKIRNTDKIFRPTFKCWSQIAKAILKLESEKQKQTREILEPVGLPPKALASEHTHGK